MKLNRRFDSSSESRVREELDDLMNAMKFRIYYDEDDPRGDLGKSPWDDQKPRDQLDAEKLKRLQEQEEKPLCRSNMGFEERI